MDHRAAWGSDEINYKKIIFSCFFFFFYPQFLSLRGNSWVSLRDRHCVAKPHACWCLSARGGPPPPPSTPLLHPLHPRSLPKSSGACLGDTHNPSTPVRGHVTEDFQGLRLIAIQINGVEARGRVSIQHCLGAVLGEWVQECGCGRRRQQDPLRDRGLGEGFQMAALLSIHWLDVYEQTT